VLIRGLFLLAALVAAIMLGVRTLLRSADSQTPTVTTTQVLPGGWVRNANHP
jgi:hypothetical protein